MTGGVSAFCPITDRRQKPRGNSFSQRVELFKLFRVLSLGERWLHHGCSLLSLLTAGEPTDGLNAPTPCPRPSSRFEGAPRVGLLLEQVAPPAGRCTGPSGTDADSFGYQSSVGGERTTRTTLTRSAHGCTDSPCSLPKSPGSQDCCQQARLAAAVSSRCEAQVAALLRRRPYRMCSHGLVAWVGAGRGHR